MVRVEREGEVTALCKDNLLAFQHPVRSPVSVYLIIINCKICVVRLT